ncbi:MAG: Stp1/IreP family PP2C-type Ser/Thr phosphatase [Bdellovibrionota bacterium]|nr:Stp1/IreP family PP2C-type Ser/Thr phosphatase [Bdellovibrionota bacterium]
MYKVSHLTNTGVKRDHNEDYYLLDEALGIYIVCDGMGGHAAGEVASEMACQEIMNFLKEQASFIKSCQKKLSKEGRVKMRTLLERATQRANEAIFNRSLREPEKKGMGTTLVMAVVVPQGIFCAHVGDSRAYLIRKGKVKQMTEDHSLVNEMIRSGMISKEDAHNHPQGNVITKALGIQKAVVGDTAFFETMEGDSVFLCSDGLHDYLNPQKIIGLYEKSSIENLSQNFIDHANKSGGKDNITCIALQFGNKEAPPAHPSQVTVDSKIQTLQKIPLFSSLNYKEMAKVLECVHVLDLKASQTVISEGEMGDDMFVILRGELAVIYDQNEVNQLKAGQFFGEMALIDKAKRSATIKTKVPSKLLQIHRDELFPLLKKESRIGLKVFWAFLQNMNKRLRESDRKVFDLYQEIKKEGTGPS